MDNKTRNQIIDEVLAVIQNTNDHMESAPDEVKEAIKDLPPEFAVRSGAEAIKQIIIFNVNELKKG